MTDGNRTPGDPVLIIESAIAASARPVFERDLAAFLPDGADLAGVLARLEAAYEGRAICPVRTAEGWAMRTRPECSGSAVAAFGERDRLGRAATETLVAIALWGPVTRSEIERIRGVALSKGTMDALLEGGLVRPGPRREGPGRPLTWLVTGRFLELFDLAAVTDIPEWKEIRDEGLVDLRRHARAEPVEAGDGGEVEEEDFGSPFDDEIAEGRDDGGGVP